MPWYYKKDDLEVGPISGQALKALASTQQISPETSVRQDGDESWETAGNVKGLFAANNHAGESRSSTPSTTHAHKSPVASQFPEQGHKLISQLSAWSRVAFDYVWAKLPSSEQIGSSSRQVVKVAREGVRSFSGLEQSGKIVSIAGLVIALLFGVLMGRGCQQHDVAGTTSTDTDMNESTATSEAFGFSLFGKPDLVVSERTDIPWPQIVDVKDESDWIDQYRTAAWISQSTLWKNRPPMRIEVQADANFLAKATLEQLTELVGKQLRSSGVTVDDSSPVTATVRLRLSTAEKTTTENGRVIKRYPIHCCSVAVLIGAKLPLLRDSGFAVSHVDLAYATMSEAYAGQFELANSISDAIDTAVDSFDSGTAQELPIKGTPLTERWKTDVRPEWREDYFRGAMGKARPSRALTTINGMQLPEITLDKIASKRFSRDYVENVWKAAAPETNLTFNATDRVWATHEVLVHEGYLNAAQRSLVRVFSSVPNYYGTTHIIVVREPVVFQYRGQMVWTNGCTYSESTRDLSLPEELRATLESGAHKAVRKFTSVR